MGEINAKQAKFLLSGVGICTHTTIDDLSPKTLNKSWVVVTSAVDDGQLALGQLKSVSVLSVERGYIRQLAVQFADGGLHGLCLGLQFQGL